MNTQKLQLGWVATLAVVLAGFLVLLGLKGVSAALPAPETVIAKEPVTIGAKSDTGWKVTLKDTAGQALQCQPKTTGMLAGWICNDANIFTQTVATPNDPTLAVKRLIRASYTSALPSGAAETKGGVTTVTLTPEEAKKIAPQLSAGHIIAGIIVEHPSGMNGDSVITVVEGDPKFVDNALAQISKEQK